MTYLGVDLGTSGLRALLTDSGGAPLGSAEAPYAVGRPHPGWSEQDPAEWIAALDRVVRSLKAAHPSFADLAGIAVSGHMHGATLVGADGDALRPCILWNDTRAAAEAAALDAREGARAVSGNIVFPGFTAPKLAWIRTHEPEVFGRIRKVLLPAAYLNLHLTGEAVGDLSDASGTAWLDTGARDWSPMLLEAGGMSRDQMPRLVEGCAPAGHLRADLARKWGLGSRPVVAGGAGDNAAAACGIGALREGEGFVSLGTSGVILAARDGYRPAPETALHTFCHAVPGRWYQMGVMLSASDGLNWLGRITGATPTQLTTDLGGLRAPGPLRFLPYLSGERTPHNDAAIRGAFTGLSTATTRDDMTRAVMEGVCYGLKDCLEALKVARAAPPALHAIGGGTRSRYWVRLLATVLNVPLHRPEGGEFGAALGAARLARIAATGESPEDIIRPPTVAETVRPDMHLADAFAAAHASHRETYPAIGGIQ